MSTVDIPQKITLLRQWQDKRLQEYGDAPVFAKTGPSSVTVLCYFYRPEEQIEQSFKYTKCAIFETWRHCGMMKTVLVVNRLHAQVQRFAEQYSSWVDIEVEGNLRPGDIDCMSTDCNSKLYLRFSTPYVLIVQDDGFPIREGLEFFIGKADYLGSPFRRRTWKGMLASCLFRHCPANGGFSLRTHKLCELTAKYWNRFYKEEKFSDEQVEDIFYTDTLPRRFWKYRIAVKIANPKVASQFSYDGCLPENIIDNPFGFHSARAFAELMRKKDRLGVR